MKTFALFLFLTFASVGTQYSHLHAAPVDKTFLEYCTDDQASEEIKKTIAALGDWVGSDDCDRLYGFVQRSELLILRGYGISDLRPLAEMTQLYELDLTDNNITDLKPLRGLTRIHWLYLGLNEIEDLTPLEDMYQLRHLEAYKNKIKYGYYILLLYYKQRCIYIYKYMDG